MSRSFESGVASYIIGEAVVRNYFPVDKKGNADICCVHCDFYREASHKCGLTGKIPEYPNKYVGKECPLEQIDIEEVT